MRPLSKIILHCSATNDDLDINANMIDNWHRKRGWRSIGYHYVIKLDGTLEFGRRVGDIGAHVASENSGSIGICYIGGLRNDKPCDTMTSEQEMTLIRLVHALRFTLGNLSLHGHNEFANKACPSFDVRKKYAFLIN